MSLTSFKSLPVCFDVGGTELLGIVEVPDKPTSVGVVVVVGGPQYRVGSHRQFVLLSRDLAQQGFAVLRFDQHGIGDSDGTLADFRAIDDDVRSAIDELQRAVPAVNKIVIWGLCDAASAAMMYASTDDRVVGLVLLNPWVRSEQGLAEAHIKSYYIRRLFSVSFWRKLFAGEMQIVQSVRDFLQSFRRAFGKRQSSGVSADDSSEDSSYIERMREGLGAFNGDVLFVLSGDDITATEYRNLTSSDKFWKRIMSSQCISVEEMPDANHTFASHQWRAAVSRYTTNWLLERVSDDVRAVE